MALINNGYKRGSKVIVEKYVDGVMDSGYPKTYDALLSFSGYNAITSSQLASLSDSEYSTRMDAFESYVESVESGASFTDNIVAGYERLKYDTTTCERGW